MSLHLQSLKRDLAANRGAVLASTVMIVFRINALAIELPPAIGLALRAIVFPIELIFTRLMLNCELPRGVRIGGGLKLLHPFGIIMNDKVVVGSDCELFHHVTLGTCYPYDEECPTIGDRVIIGTGATILGDVAIPSDSIVKAHSLIVPSEGSR